MANDSGRCVLTCNGSLTHSPSPTCVLKHSFIRPLARFLFSFSRFLSFLDYLLPSFSITLCSHIFLRFASLPLPFASHGDYAVINCGIPMRSPGVRYTGNSFSVNAELMFDCDSGYKLIDGNTKRICQRDGTWSGRDPTCRCKSYSLTHSLCLFTFTFLSAPTSQLCLNGVSTKYCTTIPLKRCFRSIIR